MWRQVALAVLITCHLSANAIEISCNFIDTVNITSGYLDQDGNYHHHGAIFTKGSFAEFDYVPVNSTTNTKVQSHLRGCICELKPCIRICCFGDDGNCAKSNNLSLPLSDENSTEIDLSSHEYGILVGSPCKFTFNLEPQEAESDKWIFSDGKVQMVNEDAAYGQHEYCFWQSNNEDGKLVTEVSVCFEDNEQPNVQLKLYPIGMIFSLPFLLITFCVYGFVPELRNLHGKSLMCYVFALMVMYIGWCIVYIEGNTFEIESFGCVFVGYMIYVSVFVCFFWLNVMCYDIWNTFRGGLRVRGGDKKKFVFYCLYAFGIPVLLTSFVITIDRVDLFSKSYLPQVGFDRCWVQQSRLIEAIYVYIPISIILAVNIAFYSITAYKIFQVQKETSVIRNGESQKHSKSAADKDRFFLYLRLFIVMGASWSMESISWLLRNRFYTFYVSDFLNCLQGFIIFMLFVWKPKVRDLIRQRYRSMRNIPQTQRQNVISMQTDTTKASSSTSSQHDLKNQEDPTEKPMLS